MTEHAPAAPGRRRPRLALTENGRALIAGLLATIGAATIEAVWLVRDDALLPHAALVGVVLVWTLFTVLHLLLTLRSYRGLDAARLRRLLLPRTSTARTQPAGAPTRGDTPGSDPADGGPADARPARAKAPARLWRRVRYQLWDRWWRTTAVSWSAQVSFLALAVVVLIISVPTLRHDDVLPILALAMVAGSWTNVVVVHATHYARLDLSRGGFDVPGDEPRQFSDYLYIALSVQTTFGTTDVQVTSAAMRRAVMGQAVLAFVFNTVIIALIVSMLLGMFSAAG